MFTRRGCSHFPRCWLILADYLDGFADNPVEKTGKTVEKNDAKVIENVIENASKVIENSSTTQKTTQKTSETTQKTTQKNEDTVEKTDDTTQKILAAMRQNPFVTIDYLCGLCKLTRDGLDWNIRKLI